MGIIKLVEKEGDNQIQNWQDAFISPTKMRGAIGIIQWKETQKGHTVENRKWITLKNLSDLLKETSRQKPLTNAYLTLNAFEKADGQFRRRTEQLAQIRNIGIDVDCYNVGMTAKQAENALQDLIVQCEIPNPNLVIWSGHGLQLIYSIQGGAAPSLSWLTKHITAQLVAKTSQLGADAACTDVTRVFRLPHTYNEKPGKTIKLVDVEKWRTLEYDLSELYAYCEPLEKRKQRISRPGLYPLPKISDMGYKLRSLNLSRINDFYKLVNLRNGQIANRNVLLYDFSYCFGLQTDDEGAVIQQAIRINDSFDDPVAAPEVERVAKNAHKDARSFWKAYLDNGYRMPPYRSKDGLIKPKKNTTLIEHHSITPEEMKDMLTIMDSNEKNARRTAKRRAAGMKSLEEHNDSQKADKAARLERLAELKTEHPDATQSQLAELIGVSLRSVKSYLKELS